MHPQVSPASKRTEPKAGQLARADVGIHIVHIVEAGIDFLVDDLQSKVTRLLTNCSCG